MRGLGLVPVVVSEEAGRCPLCNGAMVVEKSGPRSGQTLAHGAFDALETIHVCAARCLWPSGTLVRRRAASLTEALMPGSNFGYDVMVFVGLGRFLHHRQREELLTALRSEHGITISTGEVSELERRFAAYFSRPQAPTAASPPSRAATCPDRPRPWHRRGAATHRRPRARL